MSRKHKIYFACSITGEQGGKEDKKLIVSILRKQAHNVLSEVFTDLDADTERVSKVIPRKVYKGCIDMIRDCDSVVADVSKFSLGVGFEIGWSVRAKKTVIAVCKKDRWSSLSPMIKGISEPNFHIYPWKNQKDLEKIFKKELKDLYD